MRRRRAIVVAWTASFLLGAAGAHAQDRPRLSELGGARFPDRAFVLTLPEKKAITPGDVRVREDGQVVQDLTVAPGDSLGRRAFGTVLVIDASSSMHRDIDGAMAAARSFAERRNALQPLGVVTFNSATDVRLPLTTDGGDIRTALATAPRLGRETHVYDATAAALQMLRRERIKAGTVVVLSDGSDTGSRAGLQEVAAAARRTPARIYTVGLQTRAYSATTLRRLAAATRGVHTESASTVQLARVYRRLGASLANQYVLTYRSTAQLGREVKVSARVPGQPGVASTTYATAELPATMRDAADEPFIETTGGAIAVSVLCALLLGLAVLAVVAPRFSVRSRIEPYVGPNPEDERAWSTTLVERVFGDGRSQRGNRRRRWAALGEELELAAVRMTPEALIFWLAAGAIVAGSLFAVATGVAATAVLGLGVPVGALLVLRAQVARQRRAFADQLPDNLQVLASAMRAGHTFVGAVSVVMEDTPDPSRRELRRVLTDEQLGAPLQDALRTMARRMRNTDVERLALVTMLQRETGGNTAEVMDRLTETIRERSEVQRMIRSLTAQGRLTRWIVTILPPGMLALITLLNREYIEPLWTSAAGIAALSLAGTMVVAGSLIIRRIVDFEV